MVAAHSGQTTLHSVESCVRKQALRPEDAANMGYTEQSLLLFKSRRALQTGSVDTYQRRYTEKQDINTEEVVIESSRWTEGI